MNAIAFDGLEKFEYITIQFDEGEIVRITKNPPLAQNIAYQQESCGNKFKEMEEQSTYKSN